MRLAFDIGGTFTDFVLEDGDNRWHRWKTLTTHADLTVGVLAGATRLLDLAGASLAEVDEIIHATTVAANAVLERAGARTGVLTTEGFRDVLLLGRQKRHELYDLSQPKPRPLARRHMIRGVRERLDADGKVVVDLDAGSVVDAVDHLRADGIEALAICLLHSYVNPEHEQRVAAIVRARQPELLMSLSSDVCPRRGEYERTSTTVADAYVKPVMRRYLNTLLDALAELGFTGKLFVMQSNGGLTTPRLAAEHPVRIVESGPAAGVLMAAGRSDQTGHAKALTFDMGGTTAKIGLVDRGQPTIRDGFEIDTVNHRKGSGLPLSIPAIDVLEIGAGGGSIAFVEAGVIRIGPESAGSEPGPACYGRGGERCTVTDANLVLGYLSPDYFAGGTVRLDPAAARAVTEEQIAAPLGLPVEEAAWGVHLMANTTMERALLVMSVERGHDPREHCLVAFGGAGPAHAVRLADALSIPTVIVPDGAGVGSAFGLTTAAMRFSLGITCQVRVDERLPDVLRAQLPALRARCLDQHGLIEDAGTTWEHRVNIRYLGQGQEVPVDLPVEAEQVPSGEEVMALFTEEYRRRHGYVQPGTGAEIVDWLVTATTRRADRPAAPLATRPGRSAPSARRRAFFPEHGGFVDTPVWRFTDIGPGTRLDGPSLVESRDCAVVVPPGHSAHVDAHGNLVVRTGQPA